MKKCVYCDAEYSDSRRSRYCQRCYLYFRGPHKGRTYTTKYAPNGDRVCGICGRAYSNLGNHLWQSHNIDIIQYDGIQDSEV